jgi:hypothetical protein
MTDRCALCQKKTGLWGFACRCERVFCSKHRHPQDHGCTFDFKRLGKEVLEAANPRVVRRKVEPI